MAILSIELVTTIDRHTLLDALREEIGELDGWIADFRFFFEHVSNGQCDVAKSKCG